MVIRLLLAYALLFSAGVNGQVVLSGTFEDGLAQGWTARGERVTAKVNSVQAASGTRSLFISGRSDGAEGAGLRIESILQKNASYTFALSLRLAEGETPAPFQVAITRTIAGQQPVKETLATTAEAVTPDGWTRLEAAYSYAAAGATVTLTVESPESTASYYLDDFALTLTTPLDFSGIQSNFETNSAEGWLPRIGREAVEIASDAHSGSYSLLVKDRKAAFDGAKVNALGKLNTGGRYRISFWAKMAPGEPRTNLRLSQERVLAGASSYQTVIGNTPVTSAAWVRFSTLYDFALSHDGLWLYVESDSGTASFLIDDFEMNYVPPPQIQSDIPSLREVLADYFPVGAAVSEPTLLGAHGELLRKHISSMTAGNAMKWGPIHPAETTFNFAFPDQMADYAKANGMRIRGHTLLWHEQNPDWLFKDKDGKALQPSPETKALLLDRLRTHIQTVVGRYKDVVYAWDVVNEAVDQGQRDCLRATPWKQFTGTDFLDVAFQTAREVAPDAKLFYNDYDTTNPVKRACILELVKSMRARGVPVDGVGHQMHVNINYPAASDVATTLNMFAELGVVNEITEMDISVYTNNTATLDVIPDNLLMAQAARYRDLMNVFKAAKDKISNVTFWGLADDDTWLKSFPIRRLDLPLLFDEDLQAKRSFWAIVDPTRVEGLE